MQLFFQDLVFYIPVTPDKCWADSWKCFFIFFLFLNNVTIELYNMRE